MAIGAGAVPVGVPVVITASGQVCGGSAMSRTNLGGYNNPASVTETTALVGTILGFFCNSTSSGTIALSAGTGSGGAAVTGTITPSAGTWYNLPLAVAGGIYATVTNTLNVTFAVIE